MRQVWERVTPGGAAGFFGVVAESLYLIFAGLVCGHDCAPAPRRLALIGGFLLLCSFLIGRELVREYWRRH